MNTSRIDPGAGRFDSISTPALIIDRPVVDANIGRMAAMAAKAKVSLRPHAKSHKCPQIAKRQVEAGAIGICCATLAEAEAMVAAGLTGVLLTSPVVGAAKARRLAALHRHSDMMVVVDHPKHVEQLSEVLDSRDRPLSILVDVDVGQRRTGVASSEAAVSLARRIAASSVLHFAGVQGYAGHVQHVQDAGERRQAAYQAAEVLGRVVSDLTSAGMAPQVVTGSGTGSSEDDAATGIYSELQVGSYALMDSEYRHLARKDGKSLPYGNALFVLASVVSANRPNQLTVDAGTKALAVNGPPPDILIGVPVGASYRFWGDEHGIIDLPPGSKKRPAVGSRVLIGATHCDPTVNLHGMLNVVEDDGTIEHWPIVGRHGTDCRILEVCMHEGPEQASDDD